MKTQTQINTIINDIESLILDYLEKFDFSYKLYSLRKSYWIDYEMLEYNVANNYLMKFNDSMFCNYFYDAVDNLIKKNLIQETNQIQLNLGVLKGHFISLNYEILILNYLKNQNETLENIIKKNLIQETNQIQLNLGVLKGHFISLNYEILILNYLKNQNETLENITNHLLVVHKGICPAGIRRILENLVALNQIKLLTKTNSDLTDLYGI